MNALDAIQRLIDRSMRRVRLIALRAIVDDVDDSKKIQVLRVRLLDGITADTQRFQQYGFTSVPLKGTDAIALALGGNLDNVVVVAVEDRKRRTTGLKEGETEQYGPTGAHVRCRDDGAVEISADKVVILSDDVNIGEETGAEFIAQAQKVLDRLTSFMTDFNSHTHPTGTGPSGPPTVPMLVPQSVAASKAKVS